VGRTGVLALDQYPAAVIPDDRGPNASRGRIPGRKGMVMMPDEMDALLLRRGLIEVATPDPSAGVAPVYVASKRALALRSAGLTAEEVLLWPTVEQLERSA
jgi:hypothetical protein